MRLNRHSSPRRNVLTSMHARRRPGHSKPLRRRHSRRTRRNLHLRRLHFFGRLSGVAPIREQSGGPARHRQRGARTGESAKIANVWRMCDEESGQPCTSQPAAQCAHAAEVVHALSFITATFARRLWLLAASYLSLHRFPIAPVHLGLVLPAATWQGLRSVHSGYGRVTDRNTTIRDLPHSRTLGR